MHTLHWEIISTDFFFINNCYKEGLIHLYQVNTNINCHGRVEIDYSATKSNDQLAV